MAKTCNFTKCKKIILDSENPVTCDLCEKHYHQKCEKVSVSLYEVLQDPENSICWFCTKCKAAAVPIYKQVASLKKQQLEFETKLKDIESQKLDKAAVEQEVNKALDSDANKEKIAEVAKTSTKTEVDEKIKTSVKEAMIEMDEIERRKNNIIVYGAKDAADNSEQEKKAAHEEIIDLLRKLEIEETSVTQCTKLGKAEEGKRRPTLVTFKDPQEKEKAMKNLSKLKGTKWSQQKISITHDYTKAQRARQKELVDKEKREKGDANGEVFFYKVRGRPWREQVIAVKKKIAEGETNQE